MVARGISMKDVNGKVVSTQERDRRWKEAATMVSKARILAVDNAEVVEDLAAKLGKLDSRDHDLTSAATKFLWFGGQYTVRILDVRAVRALRHLHRPQRGTKIDYAWFESAWKHQFDKCTAELGTALGNLPNQFPWSAIPQQWEKCALTAIDKPWFQDRVFDQYLWAKGERATNVAV